MGVPTVTISWEAGMFRAHPWLRWPYDPQRRRSHRAHPPGPGDHLDRRRLGHCPGSAAHDARLLRLQQLVADVVGEEGIATAIGVVGLGLSLALALPMGWTLGRRGPEGLRAVLRALPLVSIAWAVLAAVLLPVGLQLVYGLQIDWIVLNQFSMIQPP